jgi:8-oxo-dGTP diphosphatase
MERFKIVPASYLILIKDGKILLSRRFNTGYEDGKYSFIAGHLDGGETFTNAIVREAKEEADVDVKPKDLEVVHVMHRKTLVDERVDVFIMAKKWSGQPKIMENDKCDDLRWFEIDNLPDNTIPYIRQAIEMIMNKISYSEHGF